jgi:hypothetical protein
VSLCVFRAPLQLDWLLEKQAGKLLLEKIYPSVKKIGFRPLLRFSLHDIIWFTLKKLRTKIVFTNFDC